MKKSYLTPNKVAELLMVSPTAVRQWAEKGELSALMTPGGHRRFLPSEVDRFARSRGLTLNLGESEKLKVLIVDDDPGISSFLTALFENVDTPVLTETARDGFSAGLKVRKLKPQIVLLDLMMPGLDGFQVCRLLKSDPATKSIRIIVMTGYASPENIENALLAGAEACINKPIDTVDLLQRLGLSKK
jgi:excisionase family DNA binding protein